MGTVRNKKVSRPGETSMAKNATLGELIPRGQD
jgi:hypothetical protein